MFLIPLWLFFLSLKILFNYGCRCHLLCPCHCTKISKLWWWLKVIYLYSNTLTDAFSCAETWAFCATIFLTCFLNECRVGIECRLLWYHIKVSVTAPKLKVVVRAATNIFLTLSNGVAAMLHRCCYNTVFFNFISFFLEKFQTMWDSS